MPHDDPDNSRPVTTLAVFIGLMLFAGLLFGLIALVDRMK